MWSSPFFFFAGFLTTCVMVSIERIELTDSCRADRYDLDRFCF